MIYINLRNLERSLSQAWKDQADDLTNQLINRSPDERAEFIKDPGNRALTWGSDELLTALREIAGNKCWYSEVRLEGNDPNVDHFRPKGRVREVDDNLVDTRSTSLGYWWLAFDYHNYRLASMHSNQRRVDATTEGGKWNYFPVGGLRAPEQTPLLEINEEVLALDPCSISDVSLLWFDPDGKAGYSTWKRTVTDYDRKRVKVTIWLYHLDKQEIELARAGHMRKIRANLELANAQYKFWNRSGPNPDIRAKNSFDSIIANILEEVSDREVFAGAKRCAIRTASAKFEWISEFLLDFS